MPENYSSGRSTRPVSMGSRTARPTGTRTQSAARAGSSAYRSSASGARPAGRPSGAGRPSSAGRPSGARPSGARPNGSRPGGYRPSGNPPRRGGRRRRKTVQPRFFIIIAVLLIVVIGIIFAVSGHHGNDPVTPIPTPTAVPNANSPSNVVISTSDVSQPGDNNGGFGDMDIGSDDEEEEQPEAIASEDRVQVSASDLSVNTSLPDTWLNILLLGTDERIANDNARTDTMIICSINKQTGQVKLTSIMRDSAIEIRGTKKYDGTKRINTANYYGGPYYAMKVVNEYLGMNIQYYATVNFFGFQRVAEALGGVDVDISEAEMNEINRKQYDQWKIAQNYGWDESGIENAKLETFGANTHLNGRQTVAYARVRKIDSDFSRAERQRIVLVKLMEKLKGKSMAELAVLGASLMDNITTNMDFDMILQVAMTVLDSGMSIGSDNMLRLPINGTYTQEVRGEDAMFYDIDWKTNANELYNFIYVK